MRTQAELLAGPDRPYDWRHRQARQLNEEGRLPSPVIHDDPTRTLVECYQLHHRCRTDFDYGRLHNRMPSVLAAYRLFKEGRDGARETVESMVLAREEATNIASLVGMTPDAIKFFEDAYFDVRGRLDMHDFILNQVIKVNRKPRSEEEFLFKAMKFYAYLAGPRSLDVFQFYAGSPIRWRHIGEVLEDIELRASALMQFGTVGPNDQMSRKATRELISMLEWNREHKGRFGDENGCRTPRELRRARVAESIAPPMSWWSSQSSGAFLNDL